MNKTKKNFWLDGVLLVAFIAVIISGFVLDHQKPHFRLGELLQSEWAVIHAGLGLAMVAGVGLHLAWHWDWIKIAFKRNGRPKPTQVRRNRTLDVWLFGLLILLGLSGLFIWPMAGQPLDDIAVVGVAYHIWRPMHTLGAVMVFVLILVHLALHWNWIILTAWRCIVPGTRAEAEKIVKA